MKSDALWALFDPYVKQILAAATGAVVLVIRSWVQRHVATNAAEEVEVRSTVSPMAGHEKKAQAMQTVQQKLPLGIRPLTDKGLGDLIERVVPAAKKRVSERPPSSTPPKSPPPIPPLPPKSN